MTMNRVPSSKLVLRRNLRNRYRTDQITTWAAAMTLKNSKMDRNDSSNEPNSIVVLRNSFIG